MPVERYHLGCPAWGLSSWVGTLLSGTPAAPSRLRQYASVFNAVEGNTTFYALPAPDTVARWAEDTPTGFRFCFKLPRVITHELELREARDETQTFLARLEPLEERLGPTMLQLPPRFGPAHLEELCRYLDGLPTDRPFAVEVRHEGFFCGGDDEARLDALLAERGVGRVMLDTRGLFAASREDRHVAAVQSRKPCLPVRARAVAGRPVVRFVPHPVYADNRPWLDGWHAALRSWIEVGLDPYFFMHAPDDRHAPEMARRFHASLRDGGLPVGRLPPFPGEQPEERPQLPLFERG